MEQLTEQLKKEVTELIVETVKKYNESKAFVDRKLADTPNDSLTVVNRRFVTLNGTVATRPVSSVAIIGQHYFATDTNIPMIYSAAGWRNGVGSIVAVNN